MKSASEKNALERSSSVPRFKTSKEKLATSIKVKSKVNKKNSILKSNLFFSLYLIKKYPRVHFYQRKNICNI